ncbi:MAG: DUF3971 domain-containing protein [Bacteroidales bacterium]|jgi:hypothetical protein|nr:DUF3971 domain-containing protein [Bacteroidales bacterium]
MQDTSLIENKNTRNRWSVKKIGIIFCSVLFFFLLFFTILAFVFQDKIADMFLMQLYNSTKVEIKHKDISFSLIRKFPMASLQVNDIQVQDLQGENILLQAEKIFLQFNILDLLRNNYTIRRIDISDADLHLIVNEKGENNWDIFLFDDSTQTKNIEIRLNTILFKNVKLLFEHYPQKTIISTVVEHLSAKGNFSENIFTTHLSSNMFVNELSVHKTIYLSNQHVQLYTKLHIDTEKNIYSIEGGNFDLDILKFTANVTLSKSEDKYHLQTHISTKNIHIDKIIKKLPESIRKKTNILKPIGILSLTFDMEGEVGKKNKLNMKGRFEWKNGSIENTENSIKLSKLNMKGAFTTTVPQTLSATKIVIDDFSANLNQGHFQGMLEVENLKQPLVNLSINGQLDLEDLHSFLPTNYFYKMTGNADIDISLKNKFTQLEKIMPQDFTHSIIEGNIVFTNALLQLRENENMLENLSGNLRFDNQVIHTDKLTGVIKGNQFELNGKIENVFPYILDNESRLHINAHVYLPELDMDKLFAKEIKEDKKNREKQQEQELVFPGNFDFEFTFKMDKLSYNQFKAQNAAGTVTLFKNILRVENLQINTCNGKLQTTGSIAQTADKDFLLKCEAKLSDIDIQKLFLAFTNFGQKNLTDKNIHGTAYSDVTFQAKLQKNITVVPSSIVSVIDVVVKNGELNNFLPLESLSKFVELNELKNVRFAVLENQIRIEHSTITIPSMEIKSNALNLSLLGKHTFSGNIDYQIKLLLKDVLGKKVKNKKQHEDFGEVLDDNTGYVYLHLLATGNIDKPIFKWDKKSAKKGLQEQFSSQKDQIREIHQRNNPPSSPENVKEKELNNPDKQQPEIEIDEDW